MVDTVNRIIKMAEHMSGCKGLAATSAVDQDMRISGGDVAEFASNLAQEFGEYVWQWPWHRFADLDEPSLLTFPYFVWRLITCPIRGRLFDPSPYERLELGHIAAVIDRGEWFEP